MPVNNQFKISIHRNTNQEADHKPKNMSEKLCFTKPLRRSSPFLYPPRCPFEPQNGLGALEKKIQHFMEDR